MQKYQPKHKTEELIKQKVLLGLKIAQSITPENLLDSDFIHEKANEYYDKLNELGNTIIKWYYEGKLKN